MNLKKFEDIKAWKAAKELVTEIYVATSKGGFSKDYGLRDQIRRAAVSAMSNIAEGFERGTDKEFVQFLIIARGSVAEVRSQLYVAHDLYYIDESQFKKLLTKASEVGKLINGFISYLRGTQNSIRTERQADQQTGRPF